MPDLPRTVRPLKLNALLAGNASVPPVGTEFSLVWMAAMVSAGATMTMVPVAGRVEGVGDGCCAWARCTCEPKFETDSTENAVPARTTPRRPVLAPFDSSLKCPSYSWARTYDQSTTANRRLSRTTRLPERCFGLCNRAPLSTVPRKENKSNHRQKIPNRNKCSATRCGTNNYFGSV